ncbi:hypothetical protein [Amycolatopsis rifamycinica]|uniref:Uncharacterized protein n=1 Tax=Amycolatopsis rifamycinica TaxID=287986 RepID=A0A066TPW7_9PSEU|nr:hypothetical protein [Amycolatopsis rifamycinica]KDN16900.1 hypothetical protein DV20_37990 [Amycolatopsis rifamycinica]
MLYIVLVLVLAALGLLVTALITASSLWAWVSIGLSVLAGLILVADWLRRRRRSAAPAAAPAAPAVSTSEPEPEAPVEEEQTTLIPASGDLGDPADTPGPAPADASAETETTADPEPGVEDTPEADIAVLADLEDEVVVVDEHPRYHLRTCEWLGTRDTIPIGVGEARQLGFTPCDRCNPDATLVAAHR